jgi:hypothetical protein
MPYIYVRLFGEFRGLPLDLRLYEHQWSRDGQEHSASGSRDLSDGHKWDGLGGLPVCLAVTAMPAVHSSLAQRNKERSHRQRPKCVR